MLLAAHRDMQAEQSVIGFCFSFPTEQTSINQGKLTHWTKGYANSDAVGRSPVDLLLEAFRRQVSPGSAHARLGLRRFDCNRHEQLQPGLCIAACSP